MKLFFWKVKKQKPKQEHPIRLGLKNSSSEIFMSDSTKKDFTELKKQLKLNKKYLEYQNGILKRDEVIYILRI
uniref:Uncharacterized protein n=1 Tax=viral metagenome TaxID=1070528 RepID=A0A6M3JGD3_9ZZZZ